jgi:hypothetical protein
MNSDNKFGESSNCPALMNDSRLFTNYLLNSKLNSYVKKVNGITDENTYRLFLQKNGSKIMDNERAFMSTNKRCNFAPIEPLPKKE